MIRIHKPNLGLVINIAFLLSIFLSPTYTYAQEIWPPFWFDLIPSYENGKIVYELEFSSRVNWQISDLTIKVALPEGTRFLEAKTLPPDRVEFNGQEITFFISLSYGYTAGNSFTVEIINPAQTIFTTQGLVVWQGEYPGSYQTEAVPFDITWQPLNWEAPFPARLQLGTKATTSNNIIAYEIYLKAIERQYRMWDVKINIPLPEGAIFISADAPLPFVAGFNGSVISFSTLELERQVEVGPLTFKIALTDTTVSALDAQIWATWKNGPRDPLPRTGPAIIYPDSEVEDPLPPAEEMIMLDVSIERPQIARQIVFDATNDTPFDDYDLSSVAFQEIGDILNITFHTVGDAAPVGQPLQYDMFIDSDCNSRTGQQRHYRGAEYRLRYTRETDRASIVQWDAQQQDWDWDRVTGLNALVDKTKIIISLPYKLLKAKHYFCWVGSSKMQTDAFYPEPPKDWVTNEKFLKLTRHKIITAGVGAKGKLAVPLNNSTGGYDVYIFSMPDGQELTKIPDARQPNFRADGRKLLINHEYNYDTKDVFEYNFIDGRKTTYVFKSYRSNKNIYEYNLADGAEKQISDSVRDSHPFYSPQGMQVVYGNSVSLFEVDDSQPARILVQCGLSPPHQEGEQHCLRPNLVLASAGQVDGLWGGSPLWAGSEMIVYRGCTFGATSAAACGIYMIAPYSTTGYGGKALPRQLTREASDIPSDTKHNLIAFTSWRDGNWEAYIMNLDGTGLRNLSNSPGSNDGLPTISPDGEWAAFVSDRGGGWAVWMSPTVGGPAQKLFNLYENTFWGDGNRAWINERISWGP